MKCQVQVECVVAAAPPPQKIHFHIATPVAYFIVCYQLKLLLRITSPPPFVLSLILVLRALTFRVVPQVGLSHFSGHNAEQIMFDY